MAASKRPPMDADALRQRLAALRRRMRMVAAIRGVSWLLVVVLATAAVAGLLDWRWHLPGLVRAAVLVATLGGASVLAYRHLFQPLSARTDDLTLALRVEDRYPLLNDALGSTVQFLERSGQPEGESAGLEREAVRRAMGKVAGCDFGKVVDARGLRTASLLAGGAVALALSLGILFPALAATAMARLADPFGGHEWPKLTQLDIESPRLRIGRNEAYEVRGKVSGVIPPQATVLFTFDGYPAVEHQCAITTDEDGISRLATKLDAGRVQRSFRFQVRANDAASPEFEVQVLAPPMLVSLDDKPSPQVKLYYPAYTGLATVEALSPGTGNVEAVTGTRVVLRARADRPLARAWIDYHPEAPFDALSAALAPLGATNLASVLSLSEGGRTVWDGVPAVLEGERDTFSVAFVPRVNGMYALHIEDDSGLHSHRLFELRLKPDPAPTVHLERPSPSRDVLSVLPTAVLNLEALVEDPQYAIRNVYLEYRTERAESPRCVFLFDPREAPGRQVALWAGPAALAAPPLALRPPRLEFRQNLSLASLKHPDGTGLKEGDIVVLQVCADDYDDVTAFKEPGRSHEVEIRIVGKNALELTLNQEQAKVQQELLRLREKERDALQKVTEVENKIKKGEKPDPEDLDKVVQAEQVQQQIRERVGDPKEGLRSEVRRILETLKQNDLENSAVRDRMRDVSRELDRLAENELSQIEPRLTNARKLAELLDEKARAERRTQLEQQARDAEKESKAAQDAADKKAAEAEKSEQAAEASANLADKARHAQDAKRQRERAEELKKRAEDLRRQAERDRRDAAESPKPDQPQKALAEARKGQEEVEKTLNDLLTRMEPWSSSREIKGEANRLLEEQKKLQADTEKLMDRKGDEALVGKDPEKLNQRQRAELENMQEEQQRLEERARQLLGKMERVAAEREDKDPETARELRGAMKDAKDVGEKMKAAREDLGRNQLTNAKTKQKEAAAELEKMVKNLEDRREAELDRLVKRMREAERELAELVQKQELLQKKVKEAAAMPAGPQREAELKRLAREQQKLQKETQEMVKQLSRLRAGRAGHALGKANEQMDDAGKQLSRGEQADQKQEDVLDRLAEAQNELEDARKKAEDELTREQLTRVADVLKGIKERQETMIAEAQRIQKQVLQNKGWTRVLKQSLLRLNEGQKGLGADTDTVGKEKLTGAPVFARHIRRAAETMKQAGERGEAMVEKSPALEDLPDADLGRLQGEALRRLTQLFDAIKSAAEAPQRAAGGGGGGGGGGGDGGGGGGGGGAGDGLPPAAQYKLLREMQADVKKKTEAFRKQHPDLNKLGDKDKTELKGIQKDQKDVTELLDELTKTPDDGREGDKE